MRATRYGLPLASREIEVLQRIAHGASYGAVAAEMYLAPASVKNYAASAIKKLGAANQTDAVRIAVERGLLEQEPAVRLPAQLVQVLELVADGRTNADIARTLSKSEHTVAEQVKDVRRRLGARDRAHAAALAVALRIVRVQLPALEQPATVNAA